MKFTDSHEWIALETDGMARVGITAFAQKELGDIVYIELPEVGKQIKAKEEAVVLESTKAAADVYSPVSGKIAGVNVKLAQMPELVNQSPEQEGWLYRLQLSDLSELDLLMDQADYQAMLNGA